MRVNPDIERAKKRDRAQGLDYTGGVGVGDVGLVEKSSKNLLPEPRPLSLGNAVLAIEAEIISTFT